MLLRIEIYINVYNNCSISMKSFTNREQYRIQTSEPIKFKKIKNEETKDKQLKKAPLERIYVQDKQNMYEKIQQLKEENGELNQLVKIQQTQINYYKGQQKRLVEKSNENSQGELGKLKVMNLRMSDKIAKLQWQLKKVKKSIKYTSIRELQNSNENFLQHIKELTAKIKTLNKGKNIEEINRIIESQYHLTLQNKKFSEEINNQKIQINKNVRMIRKMNNIITNKEKQISKLKEAFEDVNKNEGKRKNFNDYVHKDELNEKKKQVMSLSQGMQILERKLWQCENKIQLLKSENIQNINRQAMKRKELLNNSLMIFKQHSPTNNPTFLTEEQYQ